MQISTEKLALKILRHDTQNVSDLNLLEVNFDPALINLLRETKYFLSLGIEVPTEARGVFDRSKTFRRHIGSLELIVAVWNRIQKTILPVELPLVKQQIDELWARLDEGLHNLDWNSPTIDKYLDEVKVRNPYHAKSLGLVFLPRDKLWQHSFFLLCTNSDHTWLECDWEAGPAHNGHRPGAL